MHRIAHWSRARARLFIILAALGLSVAPAAAQIINQTVLTSAAASCATTPAGCAVFDLGTSTSFTMQFTGSFTGTVVFEATSDGATYVGITCINVADGSAATGTTTTGQFACQNPGFLKVRARASALSAGSIGVTGTRGWSIPWNFNPTFSNVILPAGGCVRWNADTWLQRQSAGTLGISGTSCGGSTATGGLAVGTITLASGGKILGTGSSSIEFGQSGGNNVNAVYFGASAAGVVFDNQSRIRSGSNSPESSVTAAIGSLWLRNNGSASTALYTKVSGSGNTGWMPVNNVSYGSLYEDAGSTAITVTTAGTYYQWASTTAGLATSDVTVSTSTDDITTTIAGTYRVDATMSFSATANATITVRIFKEGVGQTNCTAQRKVSAGGDVGDLMTTCLVSASANDSFAIYVTSDGNGDTVTPVEANLNIVRIGG